MRRCVLYAGIAAVLGAAGVWRVGTGDAGSGIWINPEMQSLLHPFQYARRVARTFPRHFEWIASIHPYRRDAVSALEAARGNGARGQYGPAGPGQSAAVAARVFKTKPFFAR